MYSNQAPLYYCKKLQPTHTMTKICAQKSHFHHFKMYKLLLNFAKKKQQTNKTKYRFWNSHKQLCFSTTMAIFKTYEQFIQNHLFHTHWNRPPIVCSIQLNPFPPINSQKQNSGEYPTFATISTTPFAECSHKHTNVVQMEILFWT